MKKVFVLTKNQNQKTEIFTVHSDLKGALDKIDSDFNSNYCNKDNEHDFNFNIDTINKGLDAQEAWHINVHPNYPSYHIWRKELI